MIQKHMWKPVSYSNGSTVKPSPRWGHSSCVIGDQLVLFGGYADSIYMNDVWVYHTTHMQWTQIKTFGTLPSHRSNSSLHYDHLNNQIVMFGGGGSNKTRFNSIHLLDWETKIWSEFIPKQSQLCPWERTYHSSELLYPYLIVYGGEGVADLDDLWVYNLEQKKWTEVPIQKNSAKPCGRRFHSSCLIGNEFYVIAGCYSKYRPLSDVFSIDLTNLVKNHCFEGLKWREIQIKNSSFLTRWGHASASLKNKIYIFGGRFSNDLNDILVLETDTMKIKALKASPESLPKARRRACINFIGNCLLMFGGFNTDYFNDLHFINVTDGFNKPKKYLKNTLQILKLVNNKQTSDMAIKTVLGENIYCHKGILMQNFQSESKFQFFLEKISGRETKQSLQQIIQSLYKGYGKFGVTLKLQNYCKYLPLTEEQKQNLFLKSLEKIRDSSLAQKSINIFSRRSIIRIVNNNIIELSDEEFGNFLEKNRQNTYTDVEFVINQQYVLKSNSILLTAACKYFKNIFSSKFNQSQQNKNKVIQLELPNRNVVLMEILLNFLLTSLIIVPENMSLQSWFQFYELTDYFSLNQLKEIVIYAIWTKLDESTVDSILNFSMKQNLEELALSCARLKIKNIYIQTPVCGNKYIEAAFSSCRFEIKQKILNKQGAFKKKMSSVSTQGQKENFETCNQ